MQGYIKNIETETIENNDYRRVVYTAKNMQLVLMNLRAGEEIGEEIHDLEQFLRFEAGQGKVILNDTDEYEVSDGFAVIVPAGVKHNVINTGSEELKLYSLYAPPEHKDGIVQPTKADEKEEHFDGVTTESYEV